MKELHWNFKLTQMQQYPERLNFSLTKVLDPDMSLFCSLSASTDQHQLLSLLLSCEVFYYYCARVRTE